MNITMELRKFVAPEIVTGVDARLMIGRYIVHFAAKKPMVVTDSNLPSYPWFVDIIEEINKCVKDYCMFDQVTSNPRDYEVMRGAEKFIAEKCDLIIAVGGGSSIDCAKGISIVSTNGGNILEYEGVDEINLPGPPLICIPTTAGASADVSQFAIICDTTNKIKKAIISKKVVPDLALIDVIPLMTMDPYLTACTGMDALTHAIEAYVSNAESHLTNVHALEAIHLISETIEEAVKPDRG
ncbi:MAG: iron-containing alcohol dehydrogenase, partial [Mobilitalea sp.]